MFSVIVTSEIVLSIIIYFLMRWLFRYDERKYQLKQFEKLYATLRKIYTIVPIPPQKSKSRYPFSSIFFSQSIQKSQKNELKCKN